MARYYGERYLTVDRFVRYCTDLNVKTDSQELEHYEKLGVMLPVARVIYPDDYVISRTLLRHNISTEPLRLERWPEIGRIFEKERLFPEQYSDLADEELVDSFDREMGHNACLIRPSPENYRPWDTYMIQVPSDEQYQMHESTVDHFYSYWQVHQLQFIQQYPDLYRNRVLLDHIPEEVRKHIFRPWAPDREVLREFDGKRPLFDALSFWITVYERERRRTFSTTSEKHQVKRLNQSEFAAYRSRFRAEAKMVYARFGLTVDRLYDFLAELVELYSDYRRDEHYKLSEEVRNDIINLTLLVEGCTDSDWRAVEAQLGERYAFWIRQTFRHLDLAIKERDDAHNLLEHFARKYGNKLTGPELTNPQPAFSNAEIDELLDYCMREGLSILVTALAGMVATEEEYVEKFRRVTRYTNLKNSLTALELFLRSLAAKGKISIQGGKFNDVLKAVMKHEKSWRWIGQRLSMTSARDPSEFFMHLEKLLNEPALTKSEDTYWAQVFLIAALARNLTTHFYPDDDWFYGERFGEMLSATVFALLYSWKLAQVRRWV